MNPLRRIVDWFRRLTPGTPGNPGTPGAQGEAIAARHLQKGGYRILGRNLRNRYGEIDILAQAPDGRTIVVVEVKTAEESSPHRRPEERVNRHKQRRLVALAGQFARKLNLTGHPIRFDVIAIELTAPEPTVRHHQGAFESHV